MTAAVRGEAARALAARLVAVRLHHGVLPWKGKDVSRVCWDARRGAVMRGASCWGANDTDMRTGSFLANASRLGFGMACYAFLRQSGCADVLVFLLLWRWGDILE